MGDSSVSCAFSGFTLHREEAVFIPLGPSEHAEEMIGARLTVGGYQACALFSPLTLPVRGRLNDYGKFETIQKDGNTGIIETVMELPIEKFIEACIFGETITVKNKSFEGVGCFVHAGVYDRFSKPVTDGKYVKSARSTSKLQATLRSEAEEYFRVTQEYRDANGVLAFPLPRLSFFRSLVRLRKLDGFSAELLDAYATLMVEGSMLDRVEQLFRLLRSFDYANRMLMPTVCGEQYPDHKKTAVITGYVDKIARERIRGEK